MTTLPSRRPLVGFSLVTLIVLVIAALAPLADQNDDSERIGAVGIEREGDIPLPAASV